MEIVFISTYLSLHQLELSNELYRQSNGLFTFIATKATPEMRLKLGYPELNNSTPYVFKAYESAEKKQIAKEKITNCDVLIIGSAPDEMVSSRLVMKKLTFKYSERLFRSKFTWRNLPHRIGSMLVHFIRYQNRNYYALCSSAYTAYDYSLFGCFQGRMLKWGYFPPFIKEVYPDRLVEDKNENRIVWAGRLLRLKHPDDALKVAYMLKKSGRSFHMDLIGSGELYNELVKIIEELDIADRVSLCGAMENGALRNELRKASVFLFTSDMQEGWGAVLNEAMNAGCAVVASREAGATPFLIDNGVNGFVYEKGNINELYNYVANLLDNREMRKRIALNAYKTIELEWNSENAVRKFMKICRNLVNNKSVDLPESGVCSKAPILK